MKNHLFDLAVRMGNEVTRAVSTVALQCSISVQDRKVCQCLVVTDNADRVSVVVTAPVLRAGRSAVRILGRARGFSLLRNIQTDCGAHPASC